ncbi:MAG: ComEC/Rec2 family competence protein, partial [Limisphaerales bacterium]
PDDLRIEIGERPEYLTLRGKLSATPEDKSFKKEEEESRRSMAQIEVNAYRRGTNWNPAFGKILAITPDLLSSNFFAGQTVEVTGVLKIPGGPLADGLFDYKTFLERQGIYYQLDVASLADWQLTQFSSAKLSREERFLAWAKITLQRGLPEEDEALRLIWAMSLGWKTALTDEVSEPFMRSGTMHIFAISGLHIALISGILISLLRVIRLPRVLCGLLVIPLIWFYTDATGWQSSAIRSTIMMSIIIAGWSLKRPADLVNSLAAAAFIILIWQPQQLFQAGFQLSFFVVLSIGLLLPHFEKVRKKLLKTEAMLPSELRPRWKRWLDVPIRFVTMNFATSLAAWLGSLPLVAYYFHLFTPVSLLANMLIVPLSSLALMANLGSLICGNWFPFATELFNQSGWFFMRSMIAASEWFVQNPASYTYVEAPSLLDCVLYYTILFTTLTGWLFAKIRRDRAIIVLGVVGAAWFWHWHNEQKIWRVTILPLNGGEAIFVDGRGAPNDLLIDRGNEMPAKLITKPFLRAKGINQLSHFLLTHGDLRNMGGATNVINEFRVKKVLTSPARFRSPAYRVLLEQLNSSPQLHQTIRRGDSLGVCEILHPDSSDKFSQADDATVVLRGKIYGTTFLLLSDLGRPGQNVLLERIK